MEPFHCDCSARGQLAYFCIQQGCQLDRRLCINCRYKHIKHKTICYNNKESLFCYKANMNSPYKQLYVQQLQITIQSLQNAKNKLIEYAISTINNEFQKWIQNPLILLIKTTNDQQQQIKRAAIADESATKQQLSIIAQQIRKLSKKRFQSLQFIRMMNKRLTEEFRQAKNDIEKQIQQLGSMCKMKMEPLSPYTETTFDAVYMNIIKQAKQQKQKQDKDKENHNFLYNVGKNLIEWVFADYKKHKSNQHKLEKCRMKFLKRFDRNVIGWRYDSCVSIEDWLNKAKLYDIHYLNLENKFEFNIFLIIVLFLLKKIGSTKQQYQKDSKSCKFAQIIGSYFIQQQNLKCLMFGILTQLQQLRLCKNKIQRIEGLEFQGQLKELSLWDNQIKIVQNLQYLPKLIYLRLDDNPLQQTNQAIQILKEMKTNGLKKLILPKEWNI